MYCTTPVQGRYVYVSINSTNATEILTLCELEVFPYGMCCYMYEKIVYGKYLHCKPRCVGPTYIECGNGAAAMQVSLVNLFELGPIKFFPVQISSLDLLALPQHRSHIQCKLVQLVRVYSADHDSLSMSIANI